MDSHLLDLSDQLLTGARDVSDHHPLNMASPARLEELGPGLAFVESFCNVIAVETDQGLVMVDGGSPMHAGAIHSEIRAWTQQPLHTMIYTHGHVDHVFAISQFEAEATGPAHVVAHEAVPDRFRRYDRTNGYNGRINQRQFQLGSPLFPTGFRYPDETYRSSLDVEIGGCEFRLRHDRGETDDGTWIYLPERKVLCTGDLFIWASPNCGNPQKAQRYCDEWAAALRKMATLGAELLLPGHGLPIAGAARIQGVLEDTARYLESLFDQTIEMMNAGCRLDEIIHTVTPPADLVGRPFLQPVYDEPEFVVRGIWRLYGGWYDGNPATLKPAPDTTLAAEIARLAGGADRLAERALECSENGEHRLAGHLIEMAGMASPEAREIHQARSAVFGARAQAERSTMAKGVFAWAERESKDRAQAAIEAD